MLKWQQDTGCLYKREIEKKERIYNFQQKKHFIYQKSMSVPGRHKLKVIFINTHTRQ